jgi:hypothetical protein
MKADQSLERVRVTPVRIATTISILLGIVGALLALPVAAAVLMFIEERRAEGMPAEQAAAIAVEISIDRQKEENSLPTKPDEPVCEEMNQTPT